MGGGLEDGGANGFTLEQARLELSGRPLRASSADRSWNGISLDQFDSYVVHDMIVPARDHHVISLALGPSEAVLQARCGRSFESDCWPGEVTMVPAGFRGRWDGLFPEHLRIALGTAAVAECGEALKISGSPAVALRNGFRVRDPALRHYGEIFRTELDRADHPTQELVMSSVATAFCIHVVRSYTEAVGVEARAIGHAETAAIRRVVAYLHEVRDCRPSLDDLAAIAGISRFHFSRMFAKAIGLSPTRYLERLRIERAKAMIRTHDLSLAQVAHAAGFADQSHFTRRFRHWVGCTPAVYAREHRSGV